jgi:RNAse (barnase) inhibitor barstar
MEIVINLKEMTSNDNFYDQLTSQVDFGEFLGRNLNAFWDYIDLLGGVRIYFVNYSMLNYDMKEFFIKTISLINEYNINQIRLGLSPKTFIETRILD